MTEQDQSENAYRLDSYHYDLPAELIAQEPLTQRDRSRMLVINRQECRLEHRYFYQLPKYLVPGDLLVLNDTRVMPARLKGSIIGSGVSAELLLLHREDDRHWVAMVKPGRKLKPGTRISFNGKLEAVVEDFRGAGRLVSFTGPAPLEEVLPYIGEIPLPPYIKNKLHNPELYQTIYAAQTGSAAAPTAGFHFTPAVFEALEQKGVKRTFLTLHIGPGSFQPVKSEDVRDHNMHREYYQLTDEAAAQINRSREQGGRVVAVGTTVCRVLEAVASADGTVQARKGWTDLFIYPGFKFKAVDVLLTNFHLPRSTLLMLVSAFAGRNTVLKAYREAVNKKYRFYSFGDSMLIY